MRLFPLVLLLSVGCIDEIDQRWDLDHDHVIAARATPPRVLEGQSVTLDALVAHEGRAPTIESPMRAELADPPADLSRSLTQDDLGAWHLDIFTLSRAQPQGPIAVDVLLDFANQSNSRANLSPFKVKKTVWVGEPATNPDAPAILVDGAEVTDELVLPLDRDVYIETPAGSTQRVSWLTNVGTLFQDDVARAFVRVAAEDAQSGQLVLVIRDDSTGGVAWRVVPVRVAK